MGLFPFEMQGVEGEELAFLLHFPPSLVATCRWQPFLWNSLCRLTSASFEAGFRWRDNYQSFHLSAEWEAALATHGGGSTAVEELDFKLGERKQYTILTPIYQQNPNYITFIFVLKCKLYVGDIWGCIRGNYGGRGNCQFLPTELRHPILWQPSCPCGQTRQPAVGQRPLLAALYDIIFSCQPLWHNGDFLLFTAGTSTPAGEGLAQAQMQLIAFFADRRSATEN